MTLKKGIHFLFGAKDGVEDFKQCIDKFSSVGYTVVEIPPDPFMDGNISACKELVAYAAEKDMELVFSCGFSPAHDMASDNPDIRQAGAKRVDKLIRLMDTAGIRMAAGTTWTKWPSFRTSKITLQERADIMYRTAEVYRKAIAPICDLGLYFAIEPMNRFESFLMNTSAEGIDFCEAVDNPNLGLLLDVFHMSVEEDDILGALRTAGKRLFHLHLAERNRRLPGTGDLNWDAFFRTLHEIGFSGYLNTEAFVTPEGEIAASVALWRDLSGGVDPETAMKKSVAFISQMERQYFQ